MRTTNHNSSSRSTKSALELRNNPKFSSKIVAVSMETINHRDEDRETPMSVGKFLTATISEWKPEIES